MLQQKCHHLHAFTAARLMQGRITHPIGEIDMSLPAQQHLGHLHAVMPSGHVQRGISMSVPLVNTRPPVQTGLECANQVPRCEPMQTSTPGRFWATGTQATCKTDEQGHCF